MTAPAVDPFTATTTGQRMAVYAALAQAGPVQRFPLPNGSPGWLVTGYEAARAAMNDPRLVKAPIPAITEARRQRLRESPGITTHMLQRDGADHERLRRLVSAGFTRRRIELLEPVIRTTANLLLDDLEVAARGGGPVDLIAGYAYPLPMTVICDLLGVPDELRPRLHRGTTAMSQSIGLTDEQYLPAFDDLVACLAELVAIKRERPGDDLISALIAVRDGDDALTEAELSSMAWLLIAAGHETTVHLIGNGMQALLSHPEQLVAVRADRTLIAGAVEELLRWCGPVQVTFPLVATAPLELGGTAIAPGEIVLPALLAANRDAAHIDDPDRLDITRRHHTHVAFGHGVHHCLGAPLARLEGRIAFETLLERFPDLTLAVSAEELAWQPSFLFHGLAELPVRLSP